MAATELKTGQSSPIQTLKLKFEAVVLIDCMFYAYNVEGCIQVWNSNNWQTIKNSKWPPTNKKKAAIGLNITIFLLKTLLN